MAISLKRALMGILTDWPDDLPPEWQDACGEVEFGFDNADPRLERDKMLSKDVMVMNPARWAPVVAMARVCPPRRCAFVFRRAPIGARHNAGRVR